MSESFDEVKPLFEALSLDFKNRGVKLSGIYIDNCCKWHHLHTSYFPNGPLKLDLFQAIQRITKKVSKRPHIFAQVCKDYSLVFGDQRDQTIKRKLPTPAPPTCSDGENVENRLKPDVENFVILRDALQWWKMSKIVEEKRGQNYSISRR